MNHQKKKKNATPNNYRKTLFMKCSQCVKIFVIQRAYGILSVRADLCDCERICVTVRASVWLLAWKFSLLSARTVSCLLFNIFIGRLFEFEVAATLKLTFLCSLPRYWSDERVDAYVQVGQSFLDLKILKLLCHFSSKMHLFWSFFHY